MVKSKCRVIVWVLTFLLVMSLFGGCTSNKGTDSSKKGTENQQAATVDKITSIPLPIVKQPLTLSAFVAMDVAKDGASMKSYDEKVCYKELEKKTGIHIKWFHPAAGQETEQFNLMLASGDLPDMISWNFTGIPGGPSKLIQDGVIIPLNDLIDKYSPNLKRVIASDPQISKEIRTDDNTIYNYPFMCIDKSQNSADKSPAFQTFGWQIRKDWLEKVNLPLPETLDQWYEVLKAFKTKDPNGNGKNDEIPYAAQGIPDIAVLMRSWGIDNGFFRDGSTIKHGTNTPEYKDFLGTMAKWYKEGLIDPDFAATDGKQFDAKVTGNLAGAWSGPTSGRLGRFVQLMKAKDATVKISGTVPPNIVAGKSYKFDFNSAFKVQNSGYAISKSSKYQKECAMWLDYPYSEEGGTLMNWGIEGTSYKKVDGQIRFTDDILKNAKGLSIDQALAQYSLGSTGGNLIQDSSLWLQRMSLPEQKEAIKLWAVGDKSRMLPPLTPTKEESSKLAAIMNEINTYNNEMMLKFIMGIEPLSNFDNFKQKLKSLGIEDAIKLEQAALDRYNARK